jgi:hypothetical protein
MKSITINKRLCFFIFKMYKNAPLEDKKYFNILKLIETNGQISINFSRDNTPISVHVIHVSYYENYSTSQK